MRTQVKVMIKSEGHRSKMKTIKIKAETKKFKWPKFTFEVKYNFLTKWLPDNNLSLKKKFKRKNYR